MPSCSTSKNPQGISITFTEADHKYRSVINGREIEYVSGTGFIGKYFKPFDPTGAITARCAKKEGISVAELKARWAEKGKRSCYYGTRLHETCEDVLHRRPFRNKPEDFAEELRFKHGVKIAQNILKKYDIVGIEQIVFSHKLPVPIAGTIDLLCKSKADGTYCIFDWKTNAEIDQENKYQSFCLDPISHVPDTSLGHYSLQLSLYQYLLKYAKYVPYDAKFKRALLHVTEDCTEVIKVPDLTSEIKDLIIDSAVRKRT